MSAAGNIDLLPGQATELLEGKNFLEDPTCCGRKVSLCDCISTKTVSTIAAVIGIALLIIGIVWLVGYCAPTSTAGGGSPVLQKLNAFVMSVSTSIGTDPLVLVTFPTAFGIGLTITGFVGAVEQTTLNA